MALSLWSRRKIKLSYLLVSAQLSLLCVSKKWFKNKIKILSISIRLGQLLKTDPAHGWCLNGIFQGSAVKRFPFWKKKKTIPGKRSSLLGVTHSVPPVTPDPEPYTSCAFCYFNQLHASHCTHFLLLPLHIWGGGGYWWVGGGGVTFKHQTWTPASNRRWQFGRTWPLRKRPNNNWAKKQSIAMVKKMK